jgi:hypothetical protein
MSRRAAAMRRESWRSDREGRRSGRVEGGGTSGMLSGKERKCVGGSNVCVTSEEGNGRVLRGSNSEVRTVWTDLVI